MGRGKQGWLRGRRCRRACQLRAVDTLQHRRAATPPSSSAPPACAGQVMRRLGIKQWPYRKRTSAKKITHSLEVRWGAAGGQHGQSAGGRLGTAGAAWGRESWWPAS